MKSGGVALWKSLTIEQEERILYKFEITDKNSYSFRWTNLESLFLEQMQPCDILARNELLNEAIEADTMQISQLVQSMLESPNSTAICDKASGHLELSCNDEELGIVLHWKFQPRKATSQEFCDDVVLDSVMTIKSLLENQKYLEKILKKKDAEIANLYENGGTLSKKSLHTDPFIGSLGRVFIKSGQESIATLSDCELHRFIEGCAPDSTKSSTTDEGAKIPEPKKTLERTPIRLKIDPTAHPFARKRPPESPPKAIATNAKLKKL